MITQKINLNLIPNGVMPRVNVSQYDYGSRTLEITLYNGASLFTIPTGAQVVIQGTKKDNRGFQYVDLDYSGSVVTADITQQMTVFEDEVQVELVIITGSDDNKQQLATANFILNVEQAALKDDIVVSETDIPAIQTLPEAMAEVNAAVELLEEVIPSIEGSIEEAEAWARGTKDNVPVTSEDAQYHNNSKYYAEQASGSAGSAGTNALNAEAFGAGTRNGTDVTSGDAAYQNNAKYYAGQAGNNASAASGSATAASGSALDAEAYGIGKRGGVDVTSGDPAYQNNSKYYAGLASNSANNAGTNAETAEAYAKGTRSGSAISSDDPAYNNNSKYYSEQASGYANTASDYVTSASAQSDQAQAWATGEIDGTPVASDKPQYHNSAKYWADQASQAAGGGVTSFNGRTGSVSPAYGDYDITQISPTSGATEGQVVVVNANGDFTVDDAPSSGHTIKDDSIIFTQRSNLQFTGNVSVTDDSTNDATIVDVTDSGHDIINSSGTTMTQRAGLQFGSGFSVSDDAENDQTIVETFSGSYNDLTDVPTSTVKTATDTFSTVNGGLLSKCEVELSPVQDLHGYDKPWAGGAGKNLLPMTVADIKAVNTSGTWSGNVYTNNGVAFTVLVDSNNNVTGIKVYGTPSANSELSLMSANMYTLPTGNYKLSGCSNGAPNEYYLQMFTNIDYSSGSGIYNSNGDTNATLTEVNTIVTCKIYTRNGAGLIDTIFYPMIRLATETDASFAPYSNICPISGHTESKVKRVGTNLFDPDHAQTVSGLGINANGYFSRSDQCLIVFPVKQNTTYSASLIKSNDGSRYYTLANEYPTDTTSQHASRVKFADDEVAGTRVGFTVNTSTYKYLVIGKFGTSDPQDLLSDVMIEIGDTQSPFEPYSERIYTINLGGTYYGGTVDFVSGKFVADRGYIASYNSETLPSTWISDRDEYASGTTPTVGAEVVYKLATPLEIDLTPTQIDALVGDNNLFAPIDFQEINGVEYKDIFSWQDVENLVEKEESGVKIVSFANGTDEEIAALIQAADNGDIDLYTDAGWRVGDERTVSLSAIAASGTYDGVSWSVGESQSAQTVTLVLMARDHYTLTNATSGGRTKCSFVVGVKNCLGTYGYMNSTATNTGSWSSSARRAWCNGGFRQALPSALRGIFKQFKVTTATEYNASTTTDTNDYFALFAEKEIFGSKTYSTDAEANALSSITWYETSSNRIKKQGDSGSACRWWERSPRASGAAGFCLVYSTGTASATDAGIAVGLSPFGCI